MGEFAETARLNARGTKAMDQFEEIRAWREAGYSLSGDHQDWLIAELGRARTVEDAAIALDRGYAEFGDFSDDVSAWADRVDDLCRTLERNPRPEGGT